MATLNATLTLTSTDLVEDQNLTVTLTDSLSVLGPVKTTRHIIASGSTDLATDNTVLANGSYTISYVLLYNTSSTANEIITIGTDTNTDATLNTVQFSIGAGEFAFFPWDSSIDMVADAANGNPVLEVRIFQAAV